jgi:hypothetical protein
MAMYFERGVTVISHFGRFFGLFTRTLLSSIKFSISGHMLRQLWVIHREFEVEYTRI